MPARRKSPAQHWVQGSKPQYAPTEGPQFAAGRPAMPRDLSPVAEAEWRRIVKELQRRGTLTKVDSSILELHCRTFARWRACCDDAESRPLIESQWLDKFGETHVKVTENPASKIACRLDNTLRHTLSELGCTPAARERTKPAAQPQPKERELTPEELEEKYGDQLINRRLEVRNAQ